ncbi:aminoglycoside phosphotransferase [Weizmannia acidilactici]|uniref:phosphotransferase family protein n=1 Tax=Weizmannia acidilactici TaxID=2607726 RepID=UPI00124C7A7E|nr:phosphotransferase family protein [Weizmannia acidilactici]GER66877.1 aminoglycoside phosphotransferase [Weizmannia acidilactici]
MSPDTIPVRKGEELDLTKLQAYLREHIPEMPDAPLKMSQFSAGRSNLTYQLKAGAWEAVLRRPPLGPVAPKAHDMGREFRVLKALQPFFALAPKVYLYEEDPSVVGAPFFIMERRHGVVLDTSFPTGVEPTKEKCRKISEIMVERLVELHAIPYEETGLLAMSKPDGFFERQVHGWIERYNRAKTDDIPEVEPLIDYLRDHIPKQSGAAVIHYDYKLNNAMLSEDFSKMVGLFDWEMATVGDPLADLGVALSYWTEKDDPELIKQGTGEPSVMVMDGFMTRREFIEAYAKKSGRDVSNIDYYLIFGYFKLAGICQQIYYRYKRGQTLDQRFAHLGTVVRSLIRYAAEVADKVR